MRRRKFQIFRSGVHMAGSGQTNVYTDDDLEKMEEAFNKRSGHRAKIFIGHQPDDYPHAYGEVEQLERRGSMLFAEAQVAEGMVRAVQDGRYRYCSAAFFDPHSPQNPVRGSYTLRHVALLGAEPPAVKGMAPLEFSQGSMYVSFWIDMPLEMSGGYERPAFEFSESKSYDEDSVKLHRQALSLARERQMSYTAAVFAIVQQRRK